MSDNFITKIISGGQTGVDRAALDVAIAHNILHGGWCPYGRQAEDGIIPAKYNLKETPDLTAIEKLNLDNIYKKRTELNVEDSDGTLIIVQDKPIGGTLYTIEIAEKYDRPHFIFIISTSKMEDLVSWVIRNDIHKLNVAGPRASQTLNIYNLACNILDTLLSHQLLNKLPDIVESKNIFQAKL